MNADDDDDDTDRVQERRDSNFAASTSQSGPLPPSVGLVMTSRIRTRVYAADCLLQLPILLANEPSHFDLTVKQVKQKSAIIDFILSTSQGVESR